MLVFKLGEMVTDTVTKTKGMLTHLLVDMGGELKYIYQPKGLNPETGKPVDRIVLHPVRIKDGKQEELDILFEILGTEGEDIATGFTGTIIGLIYHLNGCLHVEVKPKGILGKTGATFDAEEFDIRRMKGKAIKPLAGKALKESIKENPSPMPFSRKS
jgi:hypothetical protein